jgi:erythronate-4-phosphate dehydrogenase
MNSKLNIVADAHIWGVESAFSELPGCDVNLRILEHKHIKREVLKDADILLTRSSTRVNAELLEGTPVRFAATATIGDDHYDKAWLDANNIIWANAAGSSTGSVVEYMITTLLELHAQNLISIPDTSIGIIGAGRIGGSFAKICRAIGMKILINDPPRQRIEGDAGFCSLDEVLAKADILTLHTPLIGDGEDCTKHLLGAKQLSEFQGKGIINAGRGGCIDNAALTDWLDMDNSHFAAGKRTPAIAAPVASSTTGHCHAAYCRSLHRRQSSQHPVRL